MFFIALYYKHLLSSWMKLKHQSLLSVVIQSRSLRCSCSMYKSIHNKLLDENRRSRSLPLNLCYLMRSLR